MKFKKSVDYLKRNKGIIFKLFLIVGLGIIFSFTLFQPFEKFELYEDKSLEDEDSFKVDLREFSQPTWRNVLTNILEVPFGLEWYDICIEFESELIVDGTLGDSNLINSRLVIYSDNKEILSIPNNNEKCFTSFFDDEFTTSIKIKLTPEFIEKRDNDKAEILLNSSMNSYAKPEAKSLFVKRIFVLLSWLALVLLVVGSFELIKKKWLTA